MFDDQKAPFMEKADTKATTYLTWRTPIEYMPRSILCHTRAATQGTVKNPNNNHPIKVGDIYVTHNGHIHNDSELFEKEELKRIAQVDSEIIPALFDKYGIESAHRPLGKLDGGFAVAVVDATRPKTVVLAKGWNSPLELWEDDQVVIWGSTTGAVLDAGRELKLDVKYSDIKALTLGNIAYIDNGKLERLQFRPYDLNGGSRKKKSSTTTTRTTQTNIPNRYESWSGRQSTPRVVESGRGKRYTVTIDSKPVTYIYCDGCEASFRSNEVTLKHWSGKVVDGVKVYGDYYLCSGCLGENDAEDELEDIHNEVCKQLAHRHNTNVRFINWILFECDPDKVLDEDATRSIHLSLMDAYENLYKKLHTQSEEDEEAKLDEQFENLGVRVFESDPTTGELTQLSLETVIDNANAEEEAAKNPLQNTIRGQIS